MPFWKLVKPDDMECVSRLRRDQQSTAPVYESKILRKDGTRRWIEFRTVPIEYEGKRAILGNLLDITQRKELELDLMRANREMAAINGIMERCLCSGGDADEEMAKALAHVIDGIGGLEVGGVFLLEGSGLVLRALHGSVEELIDFIQGKEIAILLGPARVHRPDGASRTWISAPVICNGNAMGAVVLACEDAGTGDRELSFLERAASKMGILVQACSPRGQMDKSSQELLAKIQTGPAQI
jgi:PAS domain-containing protein